MCGMGSVGFSGIHEFSKYVVAKGDISRLYFISKIFTVIKDLPNLLLKLCTMIVLPDLLIFYARHSLQRGSLSKIANTFIITGASLKDGQGGQLTTLQFWT